MNDIQLIAMDLDGTLLQPDGSILPETLAALREAADRGVILTLASGRYPENTALTFIDYDMTGPVIGSNGGIIQDGPMGQTIFLHNIKRESAEAICDYLEKMEAKYILFSHKLVTTSRVGMTHRSEISDGPRIERLGNIKFGHGPEDVKKALQYGISKVFIPDHPKLREMTDALREIPGILVTRSSEHNIELMPEGIHKGHGISELARWLGIPLSAVMAFGDEENDLPMLKTVGYGLAMGNAPEHVKEQCAYVTDSFKDNGIAHMIERFILRKGN